MSENLAQMVKEGRPQESVFSENDLDIPAEQEQQEATPEAEIETSAIEIISLVDWFDRNVINFPNIKKPNVSLQGVDPSKQLIITLLIGTRDDGQEERKLMVFDNADQTPVLNVPAMDMQIYNNGFRIIYDLGTGVFIKSYGIRTGLVSVFCHDIDDMLIPYAVVRSKKKDTEVEIQTADSDIVRHHLSNQLDIEALQLRYKQSAKAEGLTTNLDAIKWLLERQSDIADVNHHLQIDNVIIDTLR